VTVRCASNHLPLGAVGPRERRFNLATALTNCPESGKVLDENSRFPTAAYFQTKLAATTTMSTTTTMTAGEVVSGAPNGTRDLAKAMKKWGYIREGE
jgi:hypothetical protein